jgi:hypothetical protein
VFVFQRAEEAVWGRAEQRFTLLLIDRTMTAAGNRDN